MLEYENSTKWVTRASVFSLYKLYQYYCIYFTHHNPEGLLYIVMLLGRIAIIKCCVLVDCDVQLVGLIKMLIVPEPIVTPNDAPADGTTTTTTVSLSVCLCVYVCVCLSVCLCVCTCYKAYRCFISYLRYLPLLQARWRNHSFCKTSTSTVCTN